MAADANKAVVRRYWEEVWNEGTLDLLPELFAPEQVAVQRRFIAATRAAFSQSHVTIEDMIAEGDKVVTRYHWRAVHSGVWDMDLHGLSMRVPPTGQAIWDAGIAIAHLRDGKIIAQPSVWTELELAQQLGAIPAPGAPA
jgi:predicted ester cyclase